MKSCEEPNTEPWDRKKTCRILEAVILSVLVVLVCGNFALPTIFYYVRPTKAGSDSLSSLNLCPEPAVYTGATCRAELQMYQECFSGSADSNGDLFIRSDIDQETVETDAQLLIEGGLSFLNPSAECVAAIRPFLCLYLFGVCDSSSQLRQVSSSECVELRDDICATEWSAALGFLGQGTLPVCEELPASQTLDESCVNITSSEVDDENITTNISNSTLQCSAGFYQNNDSMCQPVCEGNDEVFERLHNILIVLSCCITLIFGILVIVVSFTVQRELMLTFPSYFLLYLSMTAVAKVGTILIGFFDKEALFCNSIDLLDSIANPTPFCTLSGIMFYYTIVQATYWVLFHEIALFWGITFPFHYRRFKEDGYIKYIHIAAVAAGLLLPLISALAPLKDGFIPPRPAPYSCLAANADYTFYTLVLPISVLLAVATCLLIITFWLILKEFVIKKISRGKKASRVGKAQVKIMFVFCYYILLGGLVLGVFSYYVGISDQVISDQRKYYACVSIGGNTESDCRRFRSIAIDAFDDLALVSIILQGMITLVIFIFIVDCKCKKLKRRGKQTGSSNKYLVATNTVSSKV